MSLRHGFKADANRTALRLRRSLGLGPEAPIDLFALADHLEVIIVPLTIFKDEEPGAVRQLSELDTSAFSAATLPCGPTRRVILHNDGHDWRRQRSNIAHEIAHLVLKHAFTLPIDDYGCRNIDREVEEEATWLGATILIPDAAALHIVRAALSTAAACDLYGVSAPLLRMRINASGARARLARADH